MEENFLLLGALENILGKMTRKSKGNYSAHCPFCNHRKQKLEINLDKDSPNYQCWACWVCGEKGRSVKALLNHLHISSEEIGNVLQFAHKKSKFETDGESTVNHSVIQLPSEFESLYVADIRSLEANRFRQYLYRRGVTDNDFIKYNIGYCSTGKYQNRVIIPSYDANNILNYFIARSLDPNAYLKYLNPDVEKDRIIPFENCINWNEPIILCEGVFDALAIRRNVVPLLGQSISSALLTKIIKNPVPEIYVCLDNEKQALNNALRHCERLLSLGRKVYLVKTLKKDPSETGFVEMTKILQQSEELTFEKLVSLKLDL